MTQWLCRLLGSHLGTGSNPECARYNRIVLTDAWLYSQQGVWLQEHVVLDGPDVRIITHYSRQGHFLDFFKLS